MRGRKGVGLVLILVLFATVPATAETDTKQFRLVERSFHPLMNDPGYSAPPAIQVTDDGRLFAYIGTLPWFSFVPGHCHSRDHADPDERAGVIVVELTDPDHPELVDVVPTTPGATSKDVRTFSGTTTDGERRDLLVFGREACGEGLAAEQVLSPEQEEVPYPWTGFEVYDVTDPESPQRLGEWVSGGLGVHNLSVFDRPDLGGRVFVAATFAETKESGPVGVEKGEGWAQEGWVKIVEITEPTAPAPVATWGVSDHEDETECFPRAGFNAGCRVHDVQISGDGKTAYVANWDAGVVILDIEDVETPTLIGQWLPPEDRCEVGRMGDEVDGEVCELDDDGATHTVVPIRRGGRDLVLVTDEEWSTPLQGFLRVVDVTDPDPGRWRQIARYLTPNAGSDDAQYFAHQPWPGLPMPGGGDIYLGAHFDGLRVLSLEARGTKFREAAWFVADDDDHPDDIDEHPQFSGSFEGSTTIRHPISYELLVLAVEVKRGLYVLEPSEE